MGESESARAGKTYVLTFKGTWMWWGTTGQSEIRWKPCATSCQAAADALGCSSEYIEKAANAFLKSELSGDWVYRHEHIRRMREPIFELPIGLYNPDVAAFMRGEFTELQVGPIAWPWPEPKDK